MQRELLGEIRLHASAGPGEAVSNLRSLPTRSRISSSARRTYRRCSRGSRLERPELVEATDERLLQDVFRERAVAQALLEEGEKVAVIAHEGAGLTHSMPAGAVTRYVRRRSLCTVRLRWV
jgi:hypothetical protein